VKIRNIFGTFYFYKKEKILYKPKKKKICRVYRKDALIKQQ